MKTPLFHFSRLAATCGLLALALLLMPAPAGAQSRNVYDWAWVSRLGPTALRGQGFPTVPPSISSGLTESLATDAAGNIIIAGAYDPDCIFDDPNVRYQTTVGPAGSFPNSYLAKYTPSGTLAWSLDLTSNAGVYARYMAVDAAGNIYLVGSFYQQLRIGSSIVAIGSTTDANFLTKISPTGTPLWTINIEPDTPGFNRLRMLRLAVDAAGNSVVQGEFEGSLTLNGTTFAGAALKSHALVLRYDALGGPIGAFAAYTTTGTNMDRGFTGVALASTGETYLSGYVSPAATLQFGTLPAVTGPATGNASGFVVKLDAATTASWAIKTNGPASQSVDAIAMGPLGRCYALGTLIGGNMAVNTQPLTTSNPAGAMGRDIFLARIAPNGTVESLVGGGGTSRAWGLAISPLGEATFGTDGGLDWGNVRLPGAIWPTTTLAGIVQLDAAGVPQRGWQAGITFFAAALAVDGLNRPVLAGTYGGSPFTFGTQQRTSPYAWNTLIARTATTILGSRQMAQVAGLEIYPNPARQLVEIHTAKAGPTQIQLFDALGRSVRTQHLQTGQTRMELAGLAPGFYTLRVQQNDAQSFRHLVVEP